jgi:hypothetical protein
MVRALTHWQVIGEEDLEQFMTRMQQHVDRSKHNLNSLFEEVISSVEKDCTFKPSLEPTRAVSGSRSSNTTSPCPRVRLPFVESQYSERF